MVGAGVNPPTCFRTGVQRRACRLRGQRSKSDAVSRRDSLACHAVVGRGHRQQNDSGTGKTRARGVAGMVADGSVTGWLRRSLLSFVGIREAYLLPLFP